MTKKKTKISYPRIVAVGFIVLILLGALLLCLPISSSNGEWTLFIDSLFTSTSATCVTGLIVHDTFTYWSLFGQCVILCLIQIGGLGFISIISIIAVSFNKKMSLQDRQMIMQASGSGSFSETIGLLKKIIGGTFMFESIGALVLLFRFSKYMPLGSAVYFSIFHSISAFCNAGFDLMGSVNPLSSFTTFATDITVNITVICLIVIGGIGFVVWNDILNYGFNFKKYKLHSKLVLVTTVSLILTGWVVFFITEYNYSMADMTTSQKILASLFQSVTTRTAGFNTVDQSALSESGGIATNVLMLIGGSPGSTAGGMKTTTVAIMVLSVISSARNNDGIIVFKKKIDSDVIKHATAVFGIYLSAVIVFTSVLCSIEPYTVREISYEVISAIGTVGLTMGITSSLSVFSRIILILLMYSGRLGGLSLALALMQKKNNIPLDRPVGRIMIG